MSDIPARQRRLAILLISLVAYAPTLKVGFLWDDHIMIETNPAIEHWTWENVKGDFTSDAFRGHGDAYYRPAQLLANRLDYSLWGARPFGFHLTNLASHVANSLLVHELALALGFAPMAALLAGALFGVHPIPVEQLMIIAGRAELYALTFGLLALLAFFRRGAGSLPLAVAFYVVGLLFKESAVAVPLCAALILWARRASWREYGRVLALASVTLPYLWLRQQAVGAPLDGAPWQDLPRFLLRGFPRVLTDYLGLLAVPWNLHSHRMLPPLSPAWALYLVMWLGVAGWVLTRRDRRPALLLGLTVLPLLPKVPVMMAGHFVLDHWAYPSLVGFTIALGWLASSAWDRREETWSRIVIWMTLALMACWGLLVALNVQLRGTDERMYRWALHFSQSRPMRANLGVELLRLGRPDEALLYLSSIHDDLPDDILVSNALAEAYAQTYRWDRAENLLSLLLKNQPGNALTAQHLAEIRRRRSRPSPAPAAPASTVPPRAPQEPK